MTNYEKRPVVDADEQSEPLLLRYLDNLKKIADLQDENAELKEAIFPMVAHDKTRVYDELAEKWVYFTPVYKKPIRKFKADVLQRVCPPSIFERLAIAKVTYTVKTQDVIDAVHNGVISEEMAQAAEQVIETQPYFVMTDEDDEEPTDGS